MYLAPMPGGHHVIAALQDPRSCRALPPQARQSGATDRLRTRMEAPRAEELVQTSGPSIFMPSPGILLAFDEMPLHQYHLLNSSGLLGTDHSELHDSLNMARLLLWS